MNRIRYLPAALRAIEDISSYTQDKWGAEQADEYVSGLFSACERVTELPHRPIPEDFEVTGFVSIFRHHRIYWRVPEADQIIVVCILHERMHQSARLADAEDET